MSNEQAIFQGKENREPMREYGEFTLQTASNKFFFAALAAIGVFIWTTYSVTGDHTTKLALHAAQLDALQKTSDQHTTLFAEIRRMISDSERSQRADSAKLEGRIDMLGGSIQRHIEADKRIEEMMLSLINDMNLLKAEKLARNIEGKKQ